MGFSCRFLCIVSLLFGSIVSTQAFTLSSRVEAITIPSVGAAFQTVSFENSYTSPVPVCTYQLANSANPPATVRIQSAGSTSMQVRLQQFPNSSSVTPGPVYCLIAETGQTTLPDGRLIEARAVLATTTHGKFHANGFSTTATMQDISGSFSGFTNPIALGQIMTFNDSNASVFHANDCDNRNNPPFNSGFSDGICITKLIAEDSGTRVNELMAVIVAEQGTGSYAGIAYEIALGADIIQGVLNAPPYNYSLSSGFEFATASMAGTDGGDGGWAVFFGGSAVGGATLRLAIDEDIVADSDRSHTTENVAYFSVRRLPVFTASKSVDRTLIAETLTLNYDIELINTGQLDQTGVVITDTLPDGSTGSVSGPVETGGSPDGIFEVGETWTYTTTYTVTPTDITAATDLINQVSVVTDQYTTESLAAETANAATMIEPGNPSLSVVKVADEVANVAEGQLITYTYDVVNTGNQFISNITLSDVHNASGPPPVPANESLDNDVDIIGDSTDSTPNDGIWDSLAPGDSIRFSGIYTVTQQDIDTLQ